MILGYNSKSSLKIWGGHGIDWMEDNVAACRSWSDGSFINLTEQITAEDAPLALAA